jgi:peptidoglycan/xylan/chitin deacetylase (PgdA/CDA1 family)
MQSPIILVYHQITSLPPERDPYAISVTPEAFAAQMEYLHDGGYHVLRLSDAVKMMQRGEALPPKALAITFDDGYRDNYTTALPVLKRYGFPATIYLVADRMGESAVWDGERGAATPLLTWDEAREMQSAGIEFGSHTCSHPALDELEAGQARREICASKHVIEDHLSSSVATLAYPYTRFTRQVQDIVEACGYLAACGSSHVHETYFNLWRVEIGRAEADLASFRCKVSPVWKSYTQVRRALRPLRKRLW